MVVPGGSAMARRALLRSLLMSAALVLAFFLLPLEDERWWLGMTIGAAMLIATVPLAVHRLRAVLTSDRPAVDAAQAVMLLLTMIIVGFGAVYLAMNRNGTQLVGLDTRVDALYFTVTTLSTVGFGDIAARGQAARVVVTVQILVDLVFIGVAVRAFGGAARRSVAQRGQINP